MKAISKSFFILVVSFLLGACATSGPKFSELAPSISNVAPDSGRIFLYRTSILGAAVQPEVKLNGEVIAAKAEPIEDHDIIDVAGIKLEFFVE